jgi:hypothetical protein
VSIASSEHVSGAQLSAPRTIQENPILIRRIKVETQASRLAGVTSPQKA